MIAGHATGQNRAAITAIAVLIAAVFEWVIRGLPAGRREPFSRPHPPPPERSQSQSLRGAPGEVEQEVAAHLENRARVHAVDFNRWAGIGQKGRPAPRSGRRDHVLVLCRHTILGGATCAALTGDEADCAFATNES